MNSIEQRFPGVKVNRPRPTIRPRLMDAPTCPDCGHEVGTYYDPITQQDEGACHHCGWMAPLSDDGVDLAELVAVSEGRLVP